MIEHSVMLDGEYFIVGYQAFDFSVLQHVLCAHCTDIIVFNK